MTRKRERGQIETSLFLNRDFVYYYGDFYVSYEQTVIEAMLTVFALLKEINRVSLFKKVKIMFFIAG